MKNEKHVEIGFATKVNSTHTKRRVKAAVAIAKLEEQERPDCECGWFSRMPSHLAHNKGKRSTVANITFFMFYSITERQHLSIMLIYMHNFLTDQAAYASKVEIRRKRKVRKRWISAEWTTISSEPSCLRPLTMALCTRGKPEYGPRCSAAKHIKRRLWNQSEKLSQRKEQVSCSHVNE